jgi:2-dehydropantoate 2-reductase
VGALRKEGAADDARLADAERRVARLLSRDARLEAHVSANIARVQWSKLMMNLNNALDALSLLPIKRQLADEAHRWTLAACQEEALRVFDAHPDIKLERMGLFIPRITPHILRLPNWLYLLITPLRVTEEARGSMVRCAALAKPSSSTHSRTSMMSCSSSSSSLSLSPMDQSGKTCVQGGGPKWTTSTA